MFDEDNFLMDPGLVGEYNYQSGIFLEVVVVPGAKTQL